MVPLFDRDEASCVDEFNDPLSSKQVLSCAGLGVRPAPPWNGLTWAVRIVIGVLFVNPPRVLGRDSGADLLLLPYRISVSNSNGVSVRIHTSLPVSRSLSTESAGQRS